MPSGTFHKLKSLLLFGKEYAMVHTFMDAASKVLGVKHRIFGHGKKDINYIKERWGNEAAMAAQQHVIDDFRDTNKKLLETNKKMYSLNPLRIFWWIIKGSVVVMLLFMLLSVLLLPVMIEDAMSQQTPEYWDAKLEGAKFDTEDYQDDIHKGSLNTLVSLGYATPEEYGETYESLGVDEEKAKAAVQRQIEMKEWIRSS